MHSCFYLGYYAEKGFIGLVDLTKAVAYYREGSKRGDGACSVNLGVLYEKGRGVAQNRRVSMNLYRNAYSQGNRKACYNLGLYYEYGIAVEKDMQKALVYYMEGAKKGEESCMKAVVRLLDQGKQ